MRTTRRRDQQKLLAISSGGGHWTQLGRIRPAFKNKKVYFACVGREYKNDTNGERYYAFSDANRWNRLKGLWMAFQVLIIVLRVRPHIIVSTGAAGGYFALRFGKLIGAKTIWLDSIANVTQLSMSGKLVERYADLWLTQWPELAKNGGPEFSGNVLGAEFSWDSSGHEKK